MKKFAMKFVGAIFMILALIMTQIPATNVFATKDASEVFEMDGTTLVKYTGAAKTVSVSDTVKVIGEEAFAGNEYVTEITLPDGLEEISYRAFADCTSLEKIVLKDEVISISSGAFSNCSSLKEIYFGANLKELGYGVFAGCDSLVKINLSEKNTFFKYEDGLLYDDESKILYCVLKGVGHKKVSLPRTVESIMPYAFWGCDSIESVVLSEYIDSLDDYSLANLKNLRTITIPYSVKSIGLKAFADCVNLRDTTIHPTVKTIHETAFDGCVRLNIIAEPGSVAYDFYQKLAMQPIIEEEYEDVEDIIYNIHDNVVSLEDIVTGNKEGPGTSTEEKILGTTVVSSGHAVILIDNTKQTVNKGDSHKEPANNNQSGSGNTTHNSEVIDLFSTTDVKGNTIPKYTVVNNEIASKAYYGSNNMSEYSMPDNIMAINDFAYARSNITSLIIPESVTKIGYGAFYHCDSLDNVVIGKNVAEIEPFAFDNSKWINKFYSSNQEFLIVGDGILLAYNGGSSHVNIPEGVKKIAPYAFYMHTGILSVSLPDSLVEIGEASFSGCKNLEDVFGGTNVEVIKDRAFYECPLQTVKITDKVKSIGLLAFDLSDERSSKNKTAIFYGNKIPTLTYEDSSTRLSNDWYRDLALKDVLFAVVNSGVTEFENTVLDNKNSGFKGLVLSVTSEENATVNIVKSNLSNEEINNLGITDKVSVYQKTYTIANFNEFFAQNNVESADKNSGKKGVSVINKSDVLPMSEHYDALSENIETLYTVTIDELENEEHISSFKKQYKKLYGLEMPSNTCYLDIKMCETDCQIPINKLGKNGMVLSVPLPDSLMSGTLHVVALDSDGQLEEVPYTIVEICGEKIVKMQVEHFSPYAMYAYKSNQFVAEAQVKDGEAIFTLGSQKLDESPDTGDYFNPKWLLALGFGSVGVVLLLWKKKRF